MWNNRAITYEVERTSKKQNIPSDELCRGRSVIVTCRISEFIPLGQESLKKKLTEILYHRQLSSPSASSQPGKIFLKKNNPLNICFNALQFNKVQSSSGTFCNFGAIFKKRNIML